MTALEIINFARSFKNDWNTNDPYEIAKRFGIQITHSQSNLKDFTAHTVKVPGYPTVISINDIYDDFSKKVLCAHELGHALMHENCVNHFATTPANVLTNLEYEANLFAIALLADDNINNQLSLPLESMNNYLLKAIMDDNIKLKN